MVAQLVSKQAVMLLHAECRMTIPLYYAVLPFRYFPCKFMFICTLSPGTRCIAALYCLVITLLTQIQPLHSMRRKSYEYALLVKYAVFVCKIK